MTGQGTEDEAWDSEAEYARQYWAWVDLVEAEWVEDSLGTIAFEDLDFEDPQEDWG